MYSFIELWTHIDLFGCSIVDDRQFNFSEAISIEWHILLIYIETVNNNSSILEQQHNIKLDTKTFFSILHLEYYI